jgi:hypothetical protein
VLSLLLHQVDMQVLKMLGERDLEEIGLPKGPRIKVMKALHPQGMTATAGTAAAADTLEA